MCGPITRDGPFARGNEKPGDRLSRLDVTGQIMLVKIVDHAGIDLDDELPTTIG